MWEHINKKSLNRYKPIKAFKEEWGSGYKHTRLNNSNNNSKINGNNSLKTGKQGQEIASEGVHSPTEEKIKNVGKSWTYSKDYNPERKINNSSFEQDPRRNKNKDSSGIIEFQVMKRIDSQIEDSNRILTGEKRKRGSDIPRSLRSTKLTVRDLKKQIMVKNDELKKSIYYSSSYMKEDKPVESYRERNLERLNNIYSKGEDEIKNKVNLIWKILMKI